MISRSLTALRSLFGAGRRAAAGTGGVPWLYAPNPGYLQPGTKIGAYEVVGLVGSGGFGFVYRVTRDARPYALKISKWRGDDLEPEDRGESEKRLDREISALMSFRHPNIVRVHGFERWPSLEDGYPYLVMDFVEGDHLDDWRKKTSPSLRLVCEAVAGIADALGYIHRCGVFHRDLKSENVLVRRSDGAPVIVDFGISRLREAEPVTRVGYSLGTITHYAPEYAEFVGSSSFVGGSFEWRPETDLHSLGYIFYELLTGHPPFPKPSRAIGETTVLHMIRKHVPAAPSVRTRGAVPATLDEIVMRLLAKNPAARFGSGDEVASAIRRAARSGGSAWDEPSQLPAEDLSSAPTPRWGRAPGAGAPGATTPVSAAPHVAPPATGTAPRRPDGALPKVLLATGALALLGILGYVLVAKPLRQPATEGARAPAAADEGRGTAQAPGAPTPPTPPTPAAPAPPDAPADGSKADRPPTQSAPAPARPAVASVRPPEERLKQERKAKLARERAAREAARLELAVPVAAEREVAEEGALAEASKPGLGEDEIRAAVSSARGSFEKCIEAERQRGGKSRQVRLDGRRVMLRINIQPSGKVTYPTFDDVTLRGTELGACFLDVAKRMEFPASKGRNPSVDIPLVLRE